MVSRQVAQNFLVFELIFTSSTVLLSSCTLKRKFQRDFHKISLISSLLSPLQVMHFNAILFQLNSLNINLSYLRHYYLHFSSLEEDLSQIRFLFNLVALLAFR